MSLCLSTSGISVRVVVLPLRQWLSQSGLRLCLKALTIMQAPRMQAQPKAALQV